MTPSHDPLLKQPLAVRASFQAIRFLAWSNGLESFLSALGISYAFGFWIFGTHHSFSSAYPLAENVSWVLLATGVLGIIGLNLEWRQIRMASSVTAFMAWGLLAVAGMTSAADVLPRASLLIACLSIAELLVFVRLHLRMEDMRDTIEAAKMANNLHVKRFGTPLPPNRKQTDEGKQDVGSDSPGS